MKRSTILTLIGILSVILVILMVAALFVRPDSADPTQPTQTPTEHTETAPTETQPVQTELPTDPTEPPTEPAPTEPPTPTLENVGLRDTSDPDNWGVSWQVIADGSITDSISRADSISFGNAIDYFALPGVSTFRGDNYRSGAAYGYVDITEQKLETVWSREISALAKGTGSGSWSGCGWTGQPVIVQWDDATKQIMNLYPDKKEKEELTEVIYATLDGHIYFYDLEDGTYTRDPIDMGMAFKGAGSLDPRGYPIFYVGPGDSTASGKVPRMYAISLIDGSILFEYGNGDSDRYRSWTAFDSAPLIDAETDTLIWPGESGILYTIKLNTAYDAESGSLTMSPDNIVKTRYSTSSGRTLGYEASVIAVDHYIYIADNGGMLFCVDLDTMNLMWAQNVKDDINATPVFEWGDDGKGYLYIASSMEYANGTVYMGKIDAATGEYVWEVSFDDIYFDKSVSGGVLSSPVLGRKGTALEGLVIFSISRTPSYSSGLLVALDTASGEIVWQTTMNLYCWSSPVAVYSETGDAKLLLCDSGGNVMMIDGLTGEVIISVNLGANIEASPAVFNDILVVGTRGMLVCGVKIS